MAAPNILNVLYLQGRTALANTTNAVVDVLTNVPLSDKAYKINTILISNADPLNTINATVSIVRGADEFRFANNLSISVRDYRSIIDRDNQIYLEEGDTIRVQIANGRAHTICSYDIIG